MTDTVTYSEVATCEVEEVSTEKKSSEDSKGSQLPATPKWSSSNMTTIILALAVSFAAGFLVARISFPFHSASHTTSRFDAVSYDFLASRKGRDLQDALYLIWSREGPSAALKHMSKLMDDDAQIASSCHPLLHQLGRMAWRQQQQQQQGQSNSSEFLSRAFSEFLGTPDEDLLRTCNAAYLHGLLEDTLSHTEADDAQIIQEAEWIQTTICSKFQSHGTTVSNEWECQHGIGHGILQNQRKYYQTVALQRALSLCRDAKGVDLAVCHNGVWMDYWAAQGMLMDFDFFSSGQDPISICYEKFASTACPLYAPTAYLLRYPRDYAGAMQIMCRSNNTVCIDGVGTQTAKENQQDYAPVEQVCAMAPNPLLQNECFHQAIQYYTISHNSKGVPRALCENLHQFKTNCLAWVV